MQKPLRDLINSCIRQEMVTSEIIVSVVFLLIPLMILLKDIVPILTYHQRINGEQPKLVSSMNIYRQLLRLILHSLTFDIATLVPIVQDDVLHTEGRDVQTAGDRESTTCLSEDHSPPTNG